MLRRRDVLVTKHHASRGEPEDPGRSIVEGIHADRRCQEGLKMEPNEAVTKDKHQIVSGNMMFMDAL